MSTCGGLCMHQHAPKKLTWSVSKEPKHVTHLFAVTSSGSHTVCEAHDLLSLLVSWAIVGGDSVGSELIAKHDPKSTT